MRAGARRRWLVGGAVAILGLGLLMWPGTTPLAARTGGAIELRVTARLRIGEVAERVTLCIQGRTVGTLAVDRRHPEATLVVRLPRAGRYRYAVASTAVFEVGGERHPVAGRGDGVVEATAGRWAVVAGDRRHRVPSTVLEPR